MVPGINNTLHRGSLAGPGAYWPAGSYAAPDATRHWRIDRVCVLVRQW